MTFKERSAWIMLIALLISGAFLAKIVYSDFMAGTLDSVDFMTLLIFTVIQIALAIVGHSLIAAFNPDEVDELVDEREKKVVTKASHLSGNLFGFMVVSSLLLYLFMPVGAYLFYAILGSLIVSQIMEYALQLYFFSTTFE